MELSQLHYEVQMLADIANKNYKVTTEGCDKARIFECLDNQIYVTIVKFGQTETLFYEVYDPEMKGFLYDIAEGTCNTQEKLISWIQHLTEKCWITRAHIGQLISVFEAQNNVSFRGKT